MLSAAVGSSTQPTLTHRRHSRSNNSSSRPSKSLTIVLHPLAQQQQQQQRAGAVSVADASTAAPQPKGTSTQSAGATHTAASRQSSLVVEMSTEVPASAAHQHQHQQQEQEQELNAPAAFVDAVRLQVVQQQQQQKSYQDSMAWEVRVLLPQLTKPHTGVQATAVAVDSAPKEAGLLCVCVCVDPPTRHSVAVGGHGVWRGVWHDVCRLPHGSAPTCCRRTA
jgi:hypothetical protein